MNILEINVLVLAYLGDTIYENYVRKYLINKGIANVNDLQKEAVNYVSAKSQSGYLKKMMDGNFLSNEEQMQLKKYESCWRELKKELKKENLKE